MCDIFTSYLLDSLLKGALERLDSEVYYHKAQISVFCGKKLIKYIMGTSIQSFSRFNTSMFRDSWQLIVSFHAITWPFKLVRKYGHTF